MLTTEDVLYDSSPPEAPVPVPVGSKTGKFENSQWYREVTLPDMVGPEEVPPCPGNPKDAQGRRKPNMALVPPVAEIYMAAVMGHGAKKYGAFNWRVSPIRGTVYIAAARRHLAAMLDGEWLDPASKQPHAAHVACSMAILMDAKCEGTLINDLPLAGHAASVLEELTDPLEKLTDPLDDEIPF